MQGAGATHAWADVYLPGAGWVEYDPTNGLIAGDNLIRVAVTAIRRRRSRSPATFTTQGAQFLGMTVDVTVHASLTPHANAAPVESAGAAPQEPEQATQAELFAPFGEPALAAQQTQSQNARLVGTIQPMQNVEAGQAVAVEPAA